MLISYVVVIKKEKSISLRNKYKNDIDEKSRRIHFELFNKQTPPCPFWAKDGPSPYYFISVSYCDEQPLGTLRTLCSHKYNRNIVDHRR